MGSPLLFKAITTVRRRLGIKYLCITVNNYRPFSGKASPPIASSRPSATKLKILPTLPYIGSLVPPYSDTPLLDVGSFYNFYPEMRRRHGDFYRWGLPGMGKGRDGICYVLTNPNEIQKVLRQERGQKGGPYPRGMVETEWPLVKMFQESGSCLGNGNENDPDDKDGFLGRGETWRRLRTFFQTDLLSPDAADGYVPQVVRAAMLASAGAPKAAGDLNSYTNRCAFDLFCSVMYGELTKMADPAPTCISGKHIVERDTNIEFCRSSVRMFEALFTQIMSPLQLGFFTLGIKTPLYRDMVKSFDSADRIARVKYDAFLSRHNNGMLSKEEQVSYLGRAIVRQQQQAAEGTDGGVSKNELPELMGMAITAAIDTTSSMLAWNMLHLAMNPNVQETLYAELMEATSASETHDEGKGELTATAIKKRASPYLHAIFRETHRLSPAGPVTLAKENSLSDIEIHGSTIPKGSLFLMDGYSVGMDEHIVDDPLVFRPERWLPKAVAARKGTEAEILDHILMRDAFSQGSRKCPASRVAGNEALVMISQLVLDWKMEVPSGYKWKDVSYKFKGMIHPNMPQVSFTPREKLI